MSEKNKRYNIEFIRQNAAELLAQRNIAGNDAEIFVDSMLESDICGVHTHGIRMLHAYVDKLKNGQFAIGHPQVVKDSPSFTVMDSNNIIGAISAAKASQICIEKAKEYTKKYGDN